MVRVEPEARPRPVALAAGKRAPLAMAGALPAGPGYLAMVLLTGGEVGAVDVAGAVALSLIAALPALVALRGTVAAAEQQVTPVATPRGADGARLVPVDTATLARAVTAARETVRERGPREATTPQPAVPPVRSRVVHEQPPGDWVGAGAAEHDEARAASASGTGYLPRHRHRGGR